MINVNCPQCSISMAVEEKYIGKRGRCQHCGHVFRVPEPASPTILDFSSAPEGPFGGPSKDTSPFGGNRPAGPFGAARNESPFSSNGDDSPFSPSGVESPFGGPSLPTENATIFLENGGGRGGSDSGRAHSIGSAIFGSSAPAVQNDADVGSAFDEVATLGAGAAPTFSSPDSGAFNPFGGASKPKTPEPSSNPLTPPATNTPVEDFVAQAANPFGGKATMPKSSPFGKSPTPAQKRYGDSGPEKNPFGPDEAPTPVARALDKGSDEYVEVHCPNCGVGMPVQMKYVGKKGRCNRCKQLFMVSLPAAREAAPAEPEKGAAAMKDRVGPVDKTLEPSPFGTAAAASPAGAPAVGESNKSSTPPWAPVDEQAVEAEAPDPFEEEPEDAAPEATPIVGWAPIESDSPEIVGESNPFAAFDRQASEGAPGNGETAPAVPASVPATESVESAAIFADKAEPAAPPPKTKRESDPQRPVVVAKLVPSRSASGARASDRAGGLRIEAIEAFTIELVAKASAGQAIRKGKPLQRILVKVVGTNGVSGWGEIVPSPLWSAETIASIEKVIRERLSPALQGVSAWNHQTAHHLIDRTVPPGAMIGQASAKSGVDMAIHDLLARTLEIPLSLLLGGKRSHEIKLCYLLSCSSPEEAVSHFGKGIEQGFNAFKVQLGLGTERTDRHIVRALAEVSHKNTFLWLDAGQTYTLDTAIRQSQALGKLGLRLFGNPLKGGRISGYRQLVALREIPIAVDESLESPAELVEFIKGDAVDFPVVNIQRLGGLTGAVKFCETAEAAGLRLLGGGSFESDLGMAHAIHLLSRFGGDLPCDLTGRQFVDSPYLSEGLTVKAGRVLIPDQPGCGVIVDEEKVRKMAIAR